MRNYIPCVKRHRTVKWLNGTHKMINTVHSIKSQWLSPIIGTIDRRHDSAILVTWWQCLNSILNPNATITEPGIQCVAFRLPRHLPDMGVGCSPVFQSVELLRYGRHLILFWRQYIVDNYSSIGNCPNNNVYEINFD